MVKEGYYFGVPPLFLGALGLFFHAWIIAGVLMALGLFCFSFFRDPDRVIPQDDSAIVSPADGRVVVVTEEENAGRPGTRISIFLAIWNVHVNRAPAAGETMVLESCGIVRSGSRKKEQQKSPNATSRPATIHQ